MRDVPLHGLRSSSRRLLSPERLDDPIGRDHFAPVDQEKDEERPLEPRRNPDLAAFRVANADRTEDVEVHVTVPGERAYHPDQPASTGALPRQTDLRASLPRLVEIRPPPGRRATREATVLGKKLAIAIVTVVAVTISAVALAAETARTDGVEPGWQKALAIRSDALDRKYHLGTAAQQRATADATPDWAQALIAPAAKHSTESTTSVPTRSNEPPQTRHPSGQRRSTPAAKHSTGSTGLESTPASDSC